MDLMEYRRRIIASSPHLSHAEGAIATFADGTDLPLKSLIVDINPVQDLHGQASPYPAGGGKNKCLLDAETITKPSWYTGGWLGVSLNSHNGITQTRGYQQGGAGGFVVSGLPAGNWTISLDYDSSQANVCCGVYYTADGTDSHELKNASSRMTVSGSRVYMTVSIPQNQGVIFRPTYLSMTTACDLNNIQVESGSFATAFAPYENICPISGWTQVNVNHSDADMTNPATITISLGQTVYGGHLDVISGKLVVDRKYEKFDGSADETWYTYSSTGFRVPKTDIGQSVNGICNLAPTVSSASSYGVMFSANAKYIYFFQSVSKWGVSTVADLRTWLATNNVEVCYELATPITYHLDPQTVRSLVGQNNIFADTGNVALEYWAHP